MGWETMRWGHKAGGHSDDLGGVDAIVLDNDRAEAADVKHIVILLEPVAILIILNARQSPQMHSPYISSPSDGHSQAPQTSGL